MADTMSYARSNELTYALGPHSEAPIEYQHIIGGAFVDALLSIEAYDDDLELSEEPMESDLDVLREYVTDFSYNINLGFVQENEVFDRTAENIADVLSVDVQEGYNVLGEFVDEYGHPTISVSDSYGDSSATADD